MCAAFVAETVIDTVFRTALRAVTAPLPRAQIVRIQAASEYAMLLSAAAVVLLLLRFAFVNHRSGEHRPGTVVVQATVVLLIGTLFLALPVLAVR
jgi:hypothetical protein